MSSASRDVLQQLYESTLGARWRAKARWLSDKGGVCGWQGIECSNSHEVTSIDLGGIGVRGTIPSALASLTSLRVLNIDESRLSGTLPSELAKLAALQTILLAGNPKLSGTLPQLHGFPKLHELDVSGTRLSGTLATTIGVSTQMHRLQCDHTAIAGAVPTQLGQLTRVQSVFIHANPALSGTLPTELGRLTGLIHGLSLASTRISGWIPTELGAMSSLRALWLVHTQLSGTVPSSMGSMRRLGRLELHANRLSGTLPSQLAHMPLHACVLTNAQGPFQKRHSMRPVDREQPDTNHFSCPVPKLPAPCTPHLSCHGGSWQGGRRTGPEESRERGPHREAPRRSGRARYRRSWSRGVEQGP